MKIRLVSVGGDLKATEISLLLPAVVGRGRGTNLTLPHPLISRQHCELYEAGGTLMVRDLGSLNGTYVGNQRVTNAEVPPGELLTVATVNFRVVYDDASPKDDSESPLLVGDDESTRGPRRLREDLPPSPAAGMTNASRTGRRTRSGPAHDSGKRARPRLTTPRRSRLLSR